MKQHHDTLRAILQDGDVKGDRTGTGTISLFAGMMKFSLQHGFWPVPTTRKVAYRLILEELEWFIKGLISVKWLEDRNNKVWSAWAGENSGTIGPMYGEQWRNWNAHFEKVDIAAVIEIIDSLRQEYHGREGMSLSNNDIRSAINRVINEKTKLYQDGGRGGVDQLKYIVDELKNNPDSRRMVVSVWHASLLPDPKLKPKENADNGKMALAPCHSMWQVNTAPLSAMEMMRQVVYSMDEFSVIRERAMGLHRAIDTVEIATYLKEQANGIMRHLRMISPNLAYDQHHLSNDRHWDIDHLGQVAIESYVAAGKPTRKLSLLCFARSQDVPLGTVFNVGMYSYLAHMLAHDANMVPWEYTHFMGDHHIYSNQVECVEQQLARNPLRPPQILLDPSHPALDNFEASKAIVYYESHPAIKYPMAAV